MNELTITTDFDRTAYAPGDTIVGHFAWRCNDRPTTVTLRLIWITSGRGSTEVGAAGETILENPGLEGREKFSFTAPPGPNSFSGQLVTLKWALELVARPSNNHERRDLIIAPNASAIDLYAHAADKAQP